MSKEGEWCQAFMGGAIGFPAFLHKKIPPRPACREGILMEKEFSGILWICTQLRSRRRLLGFSGMDMTTAMPMASATAIFSVSAPLAAHWTVSPVIKA